MSKTINRILYGLLTSLLIFGLTQIYISQYQPSYLQLEKQKISNVVAEVRTFDPSTGLDLTGGAPAPAIMCTVTNNVHLIGTDGSDFSVNSATDYFQPTYNSVIVPENNVQLDHELVRVYLYCKTSTLSQYNYYPFLTGGTINLKVLARDVTGTNQVAYTSSQTVNNGEPNGVSMLIAEFNVPYNSINNVANSADHDYASQQTVQTSGNLIFKQALNQHIQATYSMPALNTFFGFLIQSPTGTQQEVQQYINIASPTQSNGYTLDASKSQYVQIIVGVNQYQATSGTFGTTESAPIVSIYKVINGVTDSNNPIKDFALPSNPNLSSNGGYSQWSYNIDVKSLGLSDGTYEIGLHGQQLPNGQSRSWTHVTFQVINTVSSGSSSSTNNGSTNSTTLNGCTVTQVESGYIFDGTKCTKIALDTSNLTQSAQSLINQLQSNGPIVGIIALFIFVLIIAGHFGKKHYTGYGYLPEPQQTF